ncbi:MAG: hypothetical protein ACLPKB_32875 [Xanthobacteraceae bacterium]
MKLRLRLALVVIASVAVSTPAMALDIQPDWPATPKVSHRHHLRATGRTLRSKQHKQEPPACLKHPADRCQ